MAGFYISPWLWFDGDQHGGMDYMLWESMITARMSLPAPVTIKVSGFYSPSGDTGVAEMWFRNDSTASITGRVIAAITEDSIYYPAPNGVIWHCNVPRDYLPDDSGEVVSIAPGDSILATRHFALDAAWNENQCRFHAWIQNDVMQVDSTKEIWQGYTTKVTVLGVEAHDGSTACRSCVTVAPNPVAKTATLRFEMTSAGRYRFRFFDAAGREIAQSVGVGAAGPNSVTWQCRDAAGNRLSGGVYFFRLESGGRAETGKVVLQ